MKKRIDVIASNEAYENLSTFTELEELNKTVRSYRDIIKMNVRRKDVQTRLIDLLEVLKRHSCKHLGVSHMRKNKLAEKMNLCYKTIQRLMDKLESLGMIKQVPMKRSSDMLQTCNAVVILPFVDEMSDKKPVEMNDKCPTNKTNSISLKQNNINKRNGGTYQNNQDSNEPVNNDSVDFYDYSYVSSNIPERFINSVKPFFNSASDIYKLWGRLKLAVKKTNASIIVEDHVESFVKTFKETIFNYKQNKVRKDIFGYIYGAWKNTTSEICRAHDKEVYNELYAFYYNN